MAGYSATPLARKLGIGPGHVVALLDAPPGFPRSLAPLPRDVGLHAALAGGPFDVVVCFTTRREVLERRVNEIRPALTVAGGLWIAWPKKASRVPTEVTDEVVRQVALPLGLVDDKVCAIDETWTGLRLVVRRELRSRAPR
ncbi:hypothetical protein KGA66_24220 [Actinocrinis puniceicyclus]|uniref:DUF3052 domain-containing protein n=1 Tax=Actinocrinis puniceicyclus TaxID=977794 RepID=A0A8J8BGV9_9ACTN|nr:hypothetical protein [Actinocrinis puniceicyclus]MBS2966174.1 hypothetical protein [Actinocrinis puniceicyclus]